MRPFHGTLFALSALALVACGAAQPSPASLGCDKDTDCKGARLCEQRACVDPPLRASTPAPTRPAREAARPAATSAAPVAPTASPAVPLPPGPPPRRDASGEPPPPSSTADAPPPAIDPRCGCRATDLMCKMRCAQQGNAAAPAQGAEQHDACNCPRGDLMCHMRCRQGG